MAFILSLVYRCTQQNVELVRADYYDKEIHFQEQINQQLNTNKLATGVNVLTENQVVKIEFPQSLKDSGVEGVITFMKPDNAKKDFDVTVKCDEQFSQLIPTSAVDKGIWNMIINFKSGSTPYYFEKKIMIN
ncbi:MAG: FixH family protein [Bacteroidetes bacterium]|nr:FixH family protein [Bacteroidota bacterium]